jgi:hypothetical protein
MGPKYWTHVDQMVNFLGHSEPAHHPLDARYYSVVDEPQTELMFGLTLVTNSVRNRHHR